MRYLCFTHRFSVISVNITISCILPKTRFFGLYFRCRQYGSNFIHCDVIDPQMSIFRWNDAQTWPCSRSFMVTNFGTNKSPWLHMTCVNNSNLPRILHRFPDMADCWSNFRPQHGDASFNALIGDEPLNLGCGNLASRNYRNIPLSYGAKHISIFWTV